MISKVVILVILLSVTSARAQSDRHNTSLNQAWLSCKVSESPNAVRGEGHWILYTLMIIMRLTARISGILIRHKESIIMIINPGHYTKCRELSKMV